MYNKPKYFYAFLNDTRRLKSHQVNPKKKIEWKRNEFQKWTKTKEAQKKPVMKSKIKNKQQK